MKVRKRLRAFTGVMMSRDAVEAAGVAAIAGGTYLHLGLATSLLVGGGAAVWLATMGGRRR